MDKTKAFSMKILITNDDGMFAPGLWALVKELKSIAQVVVVAPDREQSAIGGNSRRCPARLPAWFPSPCHLHSCGR